MAQSNQFDPRQRPKLNPSLLTAAPVKPKSPFELFNANTLIFLDDINLTTLNIPEDLLPEEAPPLQQWQAAISFKAPEDHVIVRLPTAQLDLFTQVMTQFERTFVVVATPETNLGILGVTVVPLDDFVTAAREYGAFQATSSATDPTSRRVRGPRDGKQWAEENTAVDLSDGTALANEIAMATGAKPESNDSADDLGDTDD